MKNKTINILSDPQDIGKRIDVFLSEKLDNITRSNIKKIINLKKVTINNELIDAQSRKIKDKDEIEVDFEEDKKVKLQPSKKSVEIIFNFLDCIDYRLFLILYNSHFTNSYT